MFSEPLAYRTYSPVWASSRNFCLPARASSAFLSGLTLRNRSIQLHKTRAIPLYLLAKQIIFKDLTTELWAKSLQVWEKSLNKTTLIVVGSWLFTRVSNSSCLISHIQNCMFSAAIKFLLPKNIFPCSFDGTKEPKCPCPVDRYSEFLYVCAERKLNSWPEVTQTEFPSLSAPTSETQPISLQWHSKSFLRQ